MKYTIERHDKNKGSFSQGKENTKVLVYKISFLHPHLARHGVPFGHTLVMINIILALLSKSMNMDVFPNKKNVQISLWRPNTYYQVFY